MKRSEWSDKEIEELLMQMPKIKDHRNPRDIYQNLSLKKRKSKPWMLPGLAAAAALLLVIILVPKLMTGTNYSHDKVQEEKSSLNNEVSSADKFNDSAIALKENDSSAESKSFSGTAKTDSIKTAVYDDEVGNGTVLTYWIPDPQAQILIPVSTVIPNSKDQSWLTLFNDNMTNLTEEEWGLTDYYPLNVTMKLDENETAILVDAPADHQYGQGSATETNFINILSKDISSNSHLRKLKFYTNSQPGIELGNFGVKEELDITDVKNHAFFFYYPENGEIPFLTPSVETYSDVNAALEAMKTDQPVLGLKSSLSALLPIHDVSIKGNTLYLSLNGNSTLQDNQLTVNSFEALLLTVKEFGIEKVVVQDSPIPQIGPFDLSQENKVPVAPNLRDTQ